MVNAAPHREVSTLSGESSDKSALTWTLVTQKETPGYMEAIAYGGCRFVVAGEFRHSSLGLGDME
jgi:hypothetical protein